MHGLMLDKETITASAYCCHFSSEMIQWKPVVHTLFKQKQAYTAQTVSRCLL